MPPMTIASASLVAMAQPSYPLRFVLATLAGWTNQRQRNVINHLQEEDRAHGNSSAPDGCGSPTISVFQRLRLAAKAMTLGRRILGTSPRLSRPTPWPGIVG